MLPSAYTTALPVVDEEDKEIVVAYEMFGGGYGHGAGMSQNGANEMAKEGKTIIVVSSEMPEILGITNRIAVMSNHKLAGIVNTAETDQETLLRLSAKYL